MARASLGNLLSVASDQGTEKPAAVADAATVTTEPSTATEVAKTAPKATPRAATRKAARPDTKPDQSAPHWSEYERLEARLRDNQVAKLDVLTRQLNKRRGGAGERITKNSLLRVAVDLLLEREGNLAGTTEAEILTRLQRNEN